MPISPGLKEHRGDSVRDTEFVKEMERRNRRSISIDLSRMKEKEIIRALVKDADIFIESSKGPCGHEEDPDEFTVGQPHLVIIVLVSAMLVIPSVFTPQHMT